MYWPVASASLREIKREDLNLATVVMRETGRSLLITTAIRLRIRQRPMQASERPAGIFHRSRARGRPRGRRATRFGRLGLEGCRGRSELILVRRSELRVGFGLTDWVPSDRPSRYDGCVRSCAGRSPGGAPAAKSGTDHCPACFPRGD